MRNNTRLICVVKLIHFANQLYDIIEHANERQCKENVWFMAKFFKLAPTPLPFMVQMDFVP